MIFHFEKKEKKYLGDKMLKPGCDIIMFVIVIMLLSSRYLK